MVGMNCGMCFKPKPGIKKSMVDDIGDDITLLSGAGAPCTG